MKKVCISTYCEWSSYGSVLQAMGLKQCLQELGFESFIVRDAPAPLAKRDFPLAISKNPKKLIKDILNLYYRPARRRQYERCVQFIKNHIDIRYYNDDRALNGNVPQAEHFLAGSDQIWHPKLCKPAFFLDFVPQGQRRLSYAASMGTTDIPAEKRDEFARLIRGFDALSARETEMADVIGSFTEKDINVHIDPTFLADGESWRKLACEYPVGKPYILVYGIYWDRKLNRQLKLLGRKTGCAIVSLSPTGRTNVWGNRRVCDADPAQFLGLIDHAQAVVSSSFHGVALALNLNKKVAAVISPKAPSRLSSLLESLQVPRCEIADVMEFDLAAYAGINERIARERARSVTYLKEILNDE